MSLFGSNLVTVGASKVVTGQVTCNSSSAVQLTSHADALSHGVFLVVKDSASYYVGLSGVTASTGVKVSANNPLFIPIKFANLIYIICGADTKVMSFICY